MLILGPSQKNTQKSIYLYQSDPNISTYICNFLKTISNLHTNDAHRLGIFDLILSFQDLHSIVILKVFYLILVKF